MHAMDAMQPVWDFSLPEFEQLQAEQAEFIWNPLPDATDPEMHPAAGLQAKLAKPVVSPDRFGILTTSGISKKELSEAQDPQAFPAGRTACCLLPARLIPLLKTRKMYLSSSSVSVQAARTAQREAKL